MPYVNGQEQARCLREVKIFEQKMFLKRHVFNKRNARLWDLFFFLMFTFFLQVNLILRCFTPGPFYLKPTILSDLLSPVARQHISRPLVPVTGMVVWLSCFVLHQS